MLLFLSGFPAQTDPQSYLPADVHCSDWQFADRPSGKTQGAFCAVLPGPAASHLPSFWTHTFPWEGTSITSNPGLQPFSGLDLITPSLSAVPTRSPLAPYLGPDKSGPHATTAVLRTRPCRTNQMCLFMIWKECRCSLNSIVCISLREPLERDVILKVSRIAVACGLARGAAVTATIRAATASVAFARCIARAFAAT